MSRILTRSLQLYKDAYSGHPVQIWILAGITLINRLGMMVLPFLTVYLTTVLGFPLRDAGLIAGAFGFGSLGGSYLGGWLSDRIGPSRVIGISLLLGGGMFILLQFAHTFSGLFLLIFTGAVFGEAYRPAMTALVGDYVPRAQTGRSMAFIRLAINLGMSLSPALGGLIAVVLGYNWLFWIDGLTCILAAILFLFLSRNWPRHQHTSTSADTHSTAVKVIPPYKNGAYLKFLLATFITGFVFIQWFHSVPVFIKSAWGFDERYIGLLMAMSSGLIVLIEMPIVHTIEKSQKIGGAMLGGLILIGLSFLPFLLPKALALCFFAAFLLTMGEIYFLPFNNAIPLNLSPPGQRGAYMSWYWMAWSLTHITGPSVGLAFIDHFGFPTFWVFLPGLIVLSWLLHRALLDRIV
ncbi:MAG: MFS transporter [Bacteroidetes bacterium]|nr:MAG: MFS transporter [Bacteroidota bacterium]